MPSRDYFPGYTGGTDVNECATRIVREFQRLNCRPSTVEMLANPPFLTPRVTSSLLTPR